MKKINTCIFDLDGVIVDTAKYHFAAWRRLANEIGIDFTETENEKLKGISRMESLDLILGWGGVEKAVEEKVALATQKNQWYLESVAQMDEKEILPGVRNFLENLMAEGIHIALGSSSKNARLILEQVNLRQFFAVVVDGTNITRSKPDPQVFQLGAEGLGVLPGQCVVFEDAVGGVTAAKTAGMFAVGMGDPTVLGHADMVLSSLENQSFTDLAEQLLNLPV